MNQSYFDVFGIDCSSMCDFLGCSMYGVISEKADKDGETEIIVEAGDMKTYKCDNEPPEVVGFHQDIEVVQAFIDGDEELCTKKAEELFDYELRTTYTDEPCSLKASERNLEYCLFKEDGGIFSRFLGDCKFHVLAPSKGSLVRIGKSGFKSQVDTVFLLSAWSEDYIDEMIEICGEYNFAFNVIDIDHKLDLSRKYYGSISGGAIRHYKIKHYIHCEPNVVQMITNGLATSVIHSDFGYTVGYKRTDKDKVYSQRFDDRRHILGCDSLFEIYKESGTFKKASPFLHDLVISRRISLHVDILYGKTVIGNSYVLIGKYHHKGNKIFNRRGQLIYENDGLNFSCKSRHRSWIKLVDEKQLQCARYVVSVFTSNCVFLGKKYPVVQSELSRGKVFEGKGTIYKVANYQYASACLVRDSIGPYIRDGYKYSEVPQLPIVRELYYYFGKDHFNDGTYHSIIARNHYVNRKDDMIKFCEGLEYDVDTYIMDGIAGNSVSVTMHNLDIFGSDEKVKDENILDVDDSESVHKDKT